MNRFERYHSVEATVPDNQGHRGKLDPYLGSDLGIGLNGSTRF